MHVNWLRALGTQEARLHLVKEEMIPTRPLVLTKHHMFFMGLMVGLLERIGESTAWTWTSIYDDQHVKMQVEDATQSQLLELCCINASISVFPLDISLIVCAVCVLSLFCRK